MDTSDMTVDSDPRYMKDVGCYVPHSWNHDLTRDWWATVSTQTSVSALKNVLPPDDVVRVYADGNTSEATFVNNKTAAHLFIVVSNSS